MSDALKLTILKTLATDGTIENTAVAFKDTSSETVLGALKSLESHEMVSYQILTTEVWTIEPEGQDQIESGSYEARIFQAVPAGEQGIAISELKAKFGAAANLGQGKGFKNGWIKKNGDNIVRVVDTIVDQTKVDLEIVQATGTHESKETIKDLKRRNLIKQNKFFSYAVAKGTCFSTELKKQEADLTVEMLKGDAWKSAEFKQFNFESLGINPRGGHLHPLLKVREEYRQIFFEMGFTEMPTNNYAESAFWNFDALFVPQQHSARELQDTFFLSDPLVSGELPDIWETVKNVHEKGGYGSIGYRASWSENEARKLVLRTHTTAVSSQMLYALAKEPYRPAKYFSIDKVYRNESVDDTHLAEFHQLEGVIVDKNMSLGRLIAFLDVFFKRLGISNIRFKPTYNPYTEPSMEIFGWHSGLDKWVELGNSGMFRPEMLRPLGLEEDVQVAGFGLSLERPTMIKCGIRNIRELVGHKVDLDTIEDNPACRLDKRTFIEVRQAAEEAARNKVSTACQ
ncbi:Phenylalanyl-tRNA synthetase, beta subunit, cytoplasmic [Coemansia thaxteri]|uniref:Probable phenylalanine--tRNA ligase alpha subunit n=1 Tax=Coemansia thaxteri TaxID=2663907 RepID=A0A9W8EGU7_9FUNG|nr:Phenylalanyl-tRNA synthetase, beta subunit, cytoplasmic [Coemansia thaxteri]KAJ2482182.1 Phenylalanyl-tRNA synthetase, beta subunit, cytoplasmic [Coemansia sp. RSA 2320]